jgi:flavin-dependent thymidylate synthase|tara:strand:- start:4727 stop:5377 length:651 start_codon:yes stop_codon:yes gene_type:complete
MKVKLVNSTSDAVDLLLFTKNTRLMNDDDSYSKISEWSEEKKQSELDYMLNTIRSSWEFIDYTFDVRDVSRGFTHQFVRTRQASYAQQSQRTVDMVGFSYYTPDRFYEPENEYQKLIYDQAMEAINMNYQQLRELGIPAEDARGILPTNIHTNIVAKFNLRTLSEMAKSRLSPRAQGEYQQVFKLMVKEVVKIHPWAEPFLTPKEWSAPSMSKSLN